MAGPWAWLLRGRLVEERRNSLNQQSQHGSRRIDGTISVAVARRTSVNKNSCFLSQWSLPRYRSRNVDSPIAKHQRFFPFPRNYRWLVCLQRRTLGEHDLLHVCIVGLFFSFAARRNLLVTLTGV